MTHSSTQGAPAPGQQAAEDWTKTRRWVSGVLLLMLLALTLGSRFSGAFQSCTDVVARVGSSPTARICEPTTLTDPSIILVLLFIIVLMSPDFSRIKFGGIIELERKVTEQTTVVRNLEDKIINMTASFSSSAANVYNITLPPDVNFADLLDGIAQKEERLTGDVSDS